MVKEGINLPTNELKASNTIGDITDRLQNDSVFRNIVCKIDELSESQLNRMDKLIDLFFIEPLKGDE